MTNISRRSVAAAVPSTPYADFGGSATCPKQRFTSIAMACALLVCGVPHWAVAGPISLAQAPAGNGGREPAPNLIISVDDSGSMGSSGMLALRNALNSSFSTASVADDSIRLGFQAMWRCRGLQQFPYDMNGGSCPDTRVQSFSGAHRNNFNAWVNSLAARSGTPSHSMFLNVHKYLENSSGVWSPFASKPGVSETPLLSCRKTFHIFMTDGGWKDTNNHRGESTNAAQMGLPGNADGSTRTLPDGRMYDPYGSTTTQTKIYRDSYAPVLNDLLGGTRSVSSRGTVSTLADWAFHMWATDYAPAVPNEVRPIIRQAGDSDFGTAGNPYVVSEYWNPRNNPMSWQGVTTYTIGFNNAANMLTNRRVWNQYTDAGHAPSQVTLPAWGGNTWGGDFSAMVRGDTTAPPLGWPNPLRGHPLTGSGEHDTSLNTDGPQSSNSPGATYDKINELWHAAINGRGRFVPATNATELSNAFTEIINQVISDSSTPMASIAANTQTVTSGTAVYIAGYDATRWSGHVKAYPVDANYNLSATPTWDAAQLLDSRSPANRLIFTHNGLTGTSLEWANLSSGQQNVLRGGDSVAVGQSRLNYVRGDRSQERASGGALRDRNSRLGDIVNSNLWVVGKPNLGYTSDDYATFRTNSASRPTMIYVGANDGMLHAFNAATGAEQFAYIPVGVFDKLKTYTDPAYTHLYSVDGHPFTGDVYDGSNWKTFLVGSLAGGGKGYFVLDVTNPANLTAANGSGLVVMDKTDGTDQDIGHIYSEPTLDTSNSERAVQITRMNNNRWALLMGNGVNSTNEKAVLLVQYLDGAKELLKIPLDSTGGNGNGLSNPQVIDINGDGKADVAYAGDMLGNLWKIDLSNTAESSWGSYFRTGSTPVPLYVAKDESNARQPITTAPQWATHPTRGLMVAVGTGREISVADRLTNSTQTLYAIWDDMTITPKASPMMNGGSAVSEAAGRSSLVEQVQESTITISGRQYFKTSSRPVSYSGAGAKRGWYLNWPTLGERSVNNGGKLSNKLLFMRSRVPASGSQDSANTESCEPTATSAKEYLTILDIVTGKPPNKPMFDTDGGGFTGTEEAGVSRLHSGRSDRLMIGTGRPGQVVSLSGKTGNVNGGGPGGGPGGGNCSGNDCPYNFSPGLPISEFGWRQLQ